MNTAQNGRIITTASLHLLLCGFAWAQQGAGMAGGNLALAAKASTSYVSGHETINALGDGSDPRNSNDKSHGAYGNWPQSGTQWVQYEWSQPVSFNKMDVYWFDDHGGVRLPKACRLLCWDGNSFVPVKDAAGLGIVENKYNTTAFKDVTTTRLKLEFDSNGKSSTGILEWKVYDNGKSPNFAPAVEAGPDRVVIVKRNTWLNGKVKDDGKPGSGLKVSWSKMSGPGEVSFDDQMSLVTSASFPEKGDYVLKLTADDGELSGNDTLKVTVDVPPPGGHLSQVYTKKYQVNSTLWTSRTKKIITNWIPHCYNKLSEPGLKEGGIDNFVEAGRKLAGQSAKGQVGPPWANAYINMTIESMCVALMMDSQGDQEIADAQKAIRSKLDEWLPKILAAQEPDGYLQTAYTLSGQKRWTNKMDHEGYIAGSFIEAAIAHYILTDRKDARMYDAAKKMADCWYENIGPAPRKYWYDGHQEIEQALARFARFVEDVEGKGKGGKYIELAKFLLDSRINGDEYDQSHVPVTRQYEAVGHAVRAVYSYSGMTDIAMETGDLDYHGAARSIWDNLVNKKYYVTGGVGSGETSEGFGPDYSLGNHAYCESCSSCGELFFQQKMNMIYRDAKYADLYEETLYNAILGDVDLEAKNFTYTNPLDSGHARYAWHGCPCCVGNFPRVFLMLPTWMYLKDDAGIYVNLFIGSSVDVDGVAGTDVRMVQVTDYPWKGDVSIWVNPEKATSFAVRIRVPNRDVSSLYTSSPEADGITSISLNGLVIKPEIVNGYAVIEREWKAGDKVDLVLPMKVQRVKASEKIAADVGRVALRYGPVVYNIETADQDIEQVLEPGTELTAQWMPDLLDGVMVVKGAFAGGKPMQAVPYYTRNNRGGRAIVWMKDCGTTPTAAQKNGGQEGLRKLMDTPLRDPSICIGPDGTYYLTGTSEPFWGFNNDNGIRVWKSRDMVAWEPLGTVWRYGGSPWHEQYLKYKKPLWAPEIHYKKGTFWLTYSMPGWNAKDPKGVDARNSGSGLLKSTSGKPEGPYVDMQPGERMGDEIDASLFEDDDGTMYFLWHSGKIARLKPDMSGLAEPCHWLKTTVSDSNPKHHARLCAGIFGKDSFDHVGFEGMFMFKAHGRYYLCCSDNFEGRYSCAVATSTNIMGPYSERVEAIPHGGHNTFFNDAQGQWWSTFFGPPYSERAAVLPVHFDGRGNVVSGK